MTNAAARCDHDSITYELKDGIWRLLPPDRLSALDGFLSHYENVRRAEGWGADDAAYYRALPWTDRSGRRNELWRARARHFRRFVAAILKPLEARQRRPLRVLDLGAGNGWLAYRLAQRGHEVAAIDLSVDERDGLGAHRHYDAAFRPIQADFDALPFEDDQADVAIFNGALHYSPDCAATVREALRVADRVIVIDSPCFEDEAGGRAMLAAQGYELEGRHQPIGFLTGRLLADVAAQTGSNLKMYPTDNDLIATLRRRWTQWRIGREPARFPVSVFQRAPRVVELPPREAYRLWAATYPPRAHNVLMQVEQAAMLARLPDVRGRHALDLACGSGRYAVLLKARGARMIGLDVSYEMLNRAGTDLPRAQSDLLRVPLCDECVDVLVCGLAVGHVADLTAALREMARVLRPGGTIVYSDFHPIGRQLGWQRTFRTAAGQQYAVQFVAHALEAHQHAAQAAGLSIEIGEVGVSAELAATNADAAWYRSRWGDTPVALVARAQKI